MKEGGEGSQDLPGAGGGAGGFLMNEENIPGCSGRGDDHGEGEVGVDGTVEFGEGGPGTELGEGSVDLIVLEDEEAVKEAEPPRDNGAVLNAGERGGLVGGEIGEVAVDAAEEIAGGEGRIDF